VTSTYDTVLARLAPVFDDLQSGADPVLRPSERCDYQVNGALALAKSLGRAPRDVADEVAAQADLAGIAEVEVAGAGFLNLTLTREFLDSQLRALALDDRLGVEVAEALTVVIDYSSPNAAKEMHVGNLRSTVIGDCLARLYRFAGHRVLARNHVGDWGTPFGMLIEHLADLGESEAVASLSIGALDAFYRDARAKFDTDEEFRERSRERVVALQAGEPETNRLWRLLIEQSITYLGEVYERLDITLSRGDVRGESSYNANLADIVGELDAKGLLVESGGALVVFAPGFTNRDGEPLPLIVQKRDEAFGYAATDLAALRDRVERLHGDVLLYVVGTPQSQHFEMVFAVARMAGWLPERVRCEHVGFGNVLGTDHKMFKSRGGETVKLLDLLDEATQRARSGLEARTSDLSDAQRDVLATQIARAAIKYADLATERQRDYVFDFDRMLAFEGDTGPYLQYAHARLRSIFRRLGAPWSPGASFTLAHPAERDLALGLLALPEAVAGALATNQPHRLCTYLFDLAQRFTAFYEACPVLAAEGAVRNERLALCDLTSRSLALGLSLLGIDAPEQM